MFKFRALMLAFIALYIFPTISAARDFNPQTGRYIEADPIGMEGGIGPLFNYADNNPLSYDDPMGLSPKDRVEWVMKQYKTNKKAWKGSFLRKQNKCNEFVAAAHDFGDPDAFFYPRVLRNDGYTLPTVEDLANPAFIPSRLEYLKISQVQPGDIVVWYGGGAHHSAIYIGNNEVIYQSASLGLKMNTVQAITDVFGQPIVRRYRY